MYSISKTFVCHAHARYPIPSAERSIHATTATTTTITSTPAGSISSARCCCPPLSTTTIPTIHNHHYHHKRIQWNDPTRYVVALVRSPALHMPYPIQSVCLSQLITSAHNVNDKFIVQSIICLHDAS